MPTFQFVAMDPQGQEIQDVIEAATQDEAQATIRSMGYFVTKISVRKGEKKKIKGEPPQDVCNRRGQRQKDRDLHPAAFHSAGRRAADLAQPKNSGRPAPAGALKNALIDVCDEIEGGSTLSEAMAKSPKVFDRLYVNMIKAGEAGGSLEIDSPPLGRIQGTNPIAQEQSRRGDDLSDHGRFVHDRYFELHHDLDHPSLQRHVRGI